MRDWAVLPVRAPISILLRREDEELGPGPARAGYRVSGSGLAWEACFHRTSSDPVNFINTHQNKAHPLHQPSAASAAGAEMALQSSPNLKRNFMPSARARAGSLLSFVGGRSADSSEVWCTPKLINELTTDQRW